MTSLRSALLAALVLAGFVPVTVAVAQAPVEWYTDTGGGGTLAQPAGQARNGGAVAPIEAGPPEGDPPADEDPTPPAATPAKAGSAHARAAAEPSLGSNSYPRAQASPAQDAPTVTGGDNQEASDAGLISALPLSGLQLAGVAGTGLFLLLAGALLRPRRRTAASR